MTPTARTVLTTLLSGAVLQSTEAQIRFGVLSIAPAILQLRKLGVPIVTRSHTLRDRAPHMPHRVYLYRISSEKLAEAQQQFGDLLTQDCS